MGNNFIIPEEGVSYMDCNVFGTNSPQGCRNEIYHITVPFLLFFLLSGLSHISVDLLKEEHKLSLLKEN